MNRPFHVVDTPLDCFCPNRILSSISFCMFLTTLDFRPSLSLPQVTCAALHKSPTFYLLVVGFASGVFGLYELPDANALHTLSISQVRGAPHATAVELDCGIRFRNG